jgi:hypothetical protein
MASGGLVLFLGDGPDAENDWIVLVDGQGIVHQYPSPWTIPSWMSGRDGVDHDVTMAAPDNGGYVAVSYNTVDEGFVPVGMQFPGVVPPFEGWSTTDGLTWMLSGPPPFAVEGDIATRSTGSSIYIRVGLADWEFGDARAWVAPTPRFLPTGGAADVRDGLVDFRTSVEAAGGRWATYGTLFPPSPDGPFWYTQDASAGWSVMPGPPWVSDNDWRVMAGYEVTPHFLLANDGQEWWIGIADDR